MTLVPVFLLWMGYLFLFRRSHVIRGWKVGLMLIAIAAGCGLSDMLFVWTHHQPTNYLPLGYGGQVGEFLYTGLMEQPLGHAGSLIILCIFYVIGLLLVFTEDPGQSLEWWLQAWISWREGRAAAAKARQAAQEKLKAARALEAQNAKAAAAFAALSTPAAPTPPKPAAPAKPEESAKGHGTLKAGESLSLFQDAEEVRDALTPEQLKKLRGEPDEPPATNKLRLPRKEKDTGPKIIAEEKVEKAPAVQQQQKKGDYIFPPLSLLAPAQARQIDSADFHQERAQQLVQTLSEFGVKVTPTEIHSGPSSPATRLCPRRACAWKRLSIWTKTLPSLCGPRACASSPPCRARALSALKCRTKPLRASACAKSLNPRRGTNLRRKFPSSWART